MTWINEMNGMSRPGNFDLNLLRSFVHIAETGNFTRAGQIVGRTQSAISMQMQRLEAMTGHPLFLRGKGGTVRLTSHGSFLVTYANEMLALNDRTWSVLHGESPQDAARAEDYALPINAQREAFTTQIMVTLLTNEKFSAAYNLIMHHAENNILVEPLRLSRKDDDLIMSLLSMLEYISINFLSNTLDRGIVFRQRKTGLLKTYEVLQDYIVHKRKAWGRPNVYHSFEEVVKNHILVGPAVAEFGTVDS